MREPTGPQSGLLCYFRHPRLWATGAGALAGTLLEGLWLAFFFFFLKRGLEASAAGPFFRSLGLPEERAILLFHLFVLLFSFLGGLTVYLLVDRQARLQLHVQKALEEAHRLNARLEEELRARKESESRFTAFAENLPGIAFLRDLEGRYVWVSDAWVRELGIPREQALGKTPRDFFPSPVAEDFLALDARVVAEGRAIQEEMGIPGPSGYREWLEICFPLPGPGGQTELVGGISVEITRRKQAERELQASEARYRRLFEENLAGVFSTRDDGSLVAINDACARIFGFASAREALAHSAQEAYPDPSLREALWERLRREGSVTGLEMAFQRLDGKGITVLLSASLSRDLLGQEILTGTMIDVTSAKEAEAALKRSEARLKAFMDQVPGVVFIRDAEGRYLYVNEAWERLTGRKASEVVGRTLEEIFTPEEAAALREEDRKTLEGEVLVWEEEPQAVGGTTRFFACTKFPLPSVEGEKPLVAGISIDVTERHQVRQALESFLDHLPGPAFVRDREGRYVFVNRAWEELIGISRKEAMGKVPGELFPPEIAEPLEAEDLQTLEGRTLLWEEEPQQFGGVERWFACAKFPVGGTAGNPLWVAGLSIDITARRRAVEALRESEERYRDLVENIADSIVLHDLEGRVLSANRAAAEVLGLSSAQELEGRFLQDHLPPENRGLFPVYLEEIRRQGRAQGLMKLVNLRGEVRIIQFNNTLKAEPGKRPLVRAVGRDVTELRRAERALRQSERRYRLLFERNLTGVFRMDLQGKLLECNEAFARMFGFSSPGEAVAASHAFSADPEDFEALRASLLAQGLAANVESLARRKDGSTFWILENAVLLEEEKGKPEVLGTVVDVTFQRELVALEARARWTETLARLVQGLAHEVRNPLFAIEVNATALSRFAGPASPETAQALAFIQEHVRRLDGLMRSLLELGQSLAPEEVTATAVRDLAQAALGVAETLDPHGFRNHTVRVELSPGLPPIPVAPRKIALALGHLLANSFQASPEGSEILLSGRREGDHLLLALADRGGGIAAEVQESLFEPFVTTRAGRTGLGLSLARHYAAIHGGTLEVASTGPRGTTLLLRLPYDGQGEARRPPTAPPSAPSGSPAPGGGSLIGP
ncbi:MAG: PAS domain S-box protein [Acidobacteriota bacterium]